MDATRIKIQTASGERLNAMQKMYGRSEEKENRHGFSAVS